MRTAISPRLATKTRVTFMNAPESKKATSNLSNSEKKLAPCRYERDLWFDDEQRLPEFDELAVLRNDFNDGSTDRGAHAVKHFHDFDQTDGSIFGDLLANFDERRRAGFWCDVKGSQERRRDR